MNFWPNQAAGAEHKPGRHRPAAYSPGASDHCPTDGFRALAISETGLRTQSRGSTTAIVLVVATVMLILGLSYNMLVRRQSTLVHQQTVREIAYSIGEATIEMASQMLKETLRNSESELFKRLTAAKTDFQSNGSYGPEPLAFQTDQGNKGIFDLFKDILDEMAEPYGGISSGNVTATVEFNPSDFKFYEGKYENNYHEKYGTVVVRVTVDFLGVKSSLGVRHQVRILSASPPVFHHFTLYIQNALAAATSAAQKEDVFNVVEMDRQGSPNQAVANPVALNNGTTNSDVQWKNFGGGSIDTFRELIYKRQGWIYLGGGPICLNLTFGENDNTFSEDFHFYRRSPSGSIRTYRDYDVENKSEFSTLRQFYQINNWDQGIYAFDASEQNETTLLKNLDNGMRKTALFHLYGKNENQAPCSSPTLVLGQVHARFLRIAAARLKPDATAADQTKNFFPLPYFKDNQAPTYAGIRTLLTATAGSGSAAETKYLDSAAQALDEGSGSLWDDWKDPAHSPILYRRVMSRPVQRAYNCSMDYIRTGNTVPSFSVAGQDRTLTEGDRFLFHTLTEDANKPPDDNNFKSIYTFKGFMDQEFSSVESRKKYFGGTSNDKFCRVFGQDTGVSPPGSDETGSNFMDALRARGLIMDPLPNSSTEQLKLGSMLFVDGDCEIGDLQTMAAGVIVVKGDIDIKGNLTDDTQTGHKQLTLCSMNGNINISSNVTDLNAYLVALSGEVINKRALCITGGVTMKKMTTASFTEWKKYGGEICYNQELKPDSSTSDYVACMFVDVSPFPIFVQQ